MAGFDGAVQEGKAGGGHCIPAQAWPNWPSRGSEGRARFSRQCRELRVEDRDADEEEHRAGAIDLPGRLKVSRPRQLVVDPAP
jgi:hypothetical protein